MKFKVGDKARVVYVRYIANIHTEWQEGAIVTIKDLTIKIAPANVPFKCDCEVTLANGGFAYPMFDQLEPIIEQLPTWEDIQSITQWNPEKVEA